MLCSGPCLSWWEDGKCLAYGGVHGMNDGTGVVWLHLSDEAKRRPLSLYRQIKDVKALAVSLPYSHYIAYDDGTDAAKRFLRALGFTRTDGNRWSCPSLCS